MVILEASELRKSLAGRPVLRGVSLSLRRGERLVVLGDNGCGKSTLLQIVASVLDADQGTLSLPHELGFASEKPDLPEHLLVGEWLDLVASLKGLRRVGEPYFGVAELLEKRASALSLGQRQRVSLASAWLGAPPLLILDEPTNGLDVQTQQEVIARLAESSALIATHDRAFADAVATRVVVMRSGQLESR